MYAPVVIIGAGQAGLAMSHHLAAEGIDHVVLERGEVANSWRTERWDSLRLLTPNWMCRLPGHAYNGDDPNGFMTARETVSFLDAYQRSLQAPVRSHVTVTSVRRRVDGFEVRTDSGIWRCDAVVVASGASSEPKVPELAVDLPVHLDRLSAVEYRRPAQLDAAGDVLVVGASASGIQIADELQRAGRQVTLAVGEHIRLPRAYRGRDIYWWMEAIGQLAERYDEVDDLDRARRRASVQLVGTPEHVTLDLNEVTCRGVRIVGRLMRVLGTRAQCSGALANLVANADLKQARLLDRIDAFVTERGLDHEHPQVERPAPTNLGEIATELDLSRFSTVIWATGYRPRFPWLDPAAFDHRGRVVHDGGLAGLAGLYLLGQTFMRRRSSNLIYGVGADAGDLLGPLRTHLDSVAHRCRLS